MQLQAELVGRIQVVVHVLVGVADLEHAPRQAEARRQSLRVVVDLGAEAQAVGSKVL